MAKKCEKCGKGSKKAAHRSNANNKSIRRQNPNLQKWHGMKICTQCIKTLNKKSKEKKQEAIERLQEESQ